jgi:hypothetical protein
MSGSASGYRVNDANSIENAVIGKTRRATENLGEAVFHDVHAELRPSEIWDQNLGPEGAPTFSRCQFGLRRARPVHTCVPLAKYNGM